MIELKTLTPFAQGGNRQCFVDPRDPARCITVRRPDFTLEDLRRKKGFPKSLLPLSHFDDNREEFEVMTALEQRIGAPAFEVVGRCYGYVDTDLGAGLSLELVRDYDGVISQTLKAYIWQNGLTDTCKQALAQFIKSWGELGIPSRDLLLHNILVQQDTPEHIQRLVVIDGLGSPNILPFWWLPKRVRHDKVQRKLVNLEQRVQTLLDKKSNGGSPGYHGMTTARTHTESSGI